MSWIIRRSNLWELWIFLSKKAPKSFHKSLPMKLWKTKSKVSMEFIGLELNFSRSKTHLPAPVTFLKRSSGNEKVPLQRRLDFIYSNHQRRLSKWIVSKENCCVNKVPFPSSRFPAQCTSTKREKQLNARLSKWGATWCIQTSCISYKLRKMFINNSCPRFENWMSLLKL